MSFKDLKKTSNSSFAAIRSKIESDQSGSVSFTDDRIWNPIVDKAGNGFAIIRFLPEIEGEDIPYVRLYNHGFKNAAGKWFIENCPTTIGGKCCVCESNSAHWNTGLKSDQQIARDRKRNLSYYANILVISNPANPKDEGKNFLFRFGAKIFEKISTAIKPEFPDESPINPFHFWEGANFLLKIRNVEGYRNYDRSSFESPKALFDGDDTLLEELWKKQYPLLDFVSPDKFKSYEELSTKFNSVISASNASKQENFVRSTNPQNSDDMDSSPPQLRKNEANSSDIDDDLKMYAELLNG